MQSQMYKLYDISILLCIISGVFGHAALVTPKPWWWAASRDRPCGGANYTAVPKAVWPVGSNQSVEWWVIAGDGMGEVHVKINLRGNTDFNNWTYLQWLPFEQPKIDKLGYFTLSTTVPNVQCDGPNNTCTLQFYTDSGGGWYSCTTVKIVCNGCEGGIPISRDDCVKASNLSFCKAKSGNQVLVPDGQTADQIDKLTQETFDLNHQNPNVFTNGNTSACMTALNEMLCELYLTPCGNSSSSYTRQKCNQTLTTCGLTAPHKGLYNCSVFKDAPVTTTSKSSTTSKTTTTTTTSKSTTTGTTTSKATTSSTTTAKATTSTTAKTTSSLINDDTLLQPAISSGTKIDLTYFFTGFLLLLLVYLM